MEIGGIKVCSVVTIYVTLSLNLYYFKLHFLLTEVSMQI